MAGCLMGRALVEAGEANVTMFDDPKSCEATPCSQNLYEAPAQPKEWVTQALSRLAGYGLTVIPFNEGRRPLFHLPLENIVTGHPHERLRRRVERVTTFNGRIALADSAGGYHEFDHVYVCTGAFAGLRVAGVPLFAPVAGHRLILRGQTPPVYRNKQAAFNWTEDYVSFTDDTREPLKHYHARLGPLLRRSERRAEAFGLGQRVMVHSGIMPYGILKPHKSYGSAGNIHWVNGGRTIGMVAYAYTTSRLAEEVTNPPFSIIWKR